MKSGVIVKIASAACVVALALGILVGCAGGSGMAANEEQQANRNYMSQVNQTMTELKADLDGFIDAVSREDIVNMRLQAENAYKTLDKFESIDVPESMTDIHDCYTTGTAKLREALDAYITLYTEASGDDFDWSKYDKRIAEVQKLYDEGVAALEEGDEIAASKS